MRRIFRGRRPILMRRFPQIWVRLACPLQSVLEQAGARAVELTRTLENFTALEEIRYQRIGPDDHVEESDSSTFDYNFGFENHGAGRSTQEYRNTGERGAYVSVKHSRRWPCSDGLNFSSRSAKRL